MEMRLCYYLKGRGKLTTTFCSGYGGCIVYFGSCVKQAAELLNIVVFKVRNFQVMGSFGMWAYVRCLRLVGKPYCECL